MKGYPEIMFIHPSGHFNDRVVPIGAITSVNAVTHSKGGRYAFEVTEDEIRAARVIAVDLHWTVALPGFVRLVEHVRRLAPTTPIVVGGISAGYYVKDLVTGGLADYVLVGDSEPSFAALVDWLVRGREPPPIPNVLSARDISDPILRRISRHEFNSLDPLTLDWFPSCQGLARAPNWAFNPGPTITVVRGCTARCPECYGSCAPLFGRGVLSLTPRRLNALIRRAHDEQVPSLRLLIGKPSARYLVTLFRLLARSGPYRIADLGLNLCTPPPDEGIDLLERAFDCPISISMTPPNEHVPALSPTRLGLETAEWIRVAHRFGKSKRLMLDVWTSTAESADEWRRILAEANVPRPKVSQSCVWQMTRPTGKGILTMAEALNAFEPFWTYYTVRMLVPGLSRALAAFRHLDEIVEDPEAATPPSGIWAPYWREALEQWRLHRLPMIRGLSFQMAPVAGPVSFREPMIAGVAMFGDLAEIVGEAMYPTGQPSPLVIRHDHAGTSLEGEVALPNDTVALLLIPCLDGSPCETLVGLAGLPSRGASQARLLVRVQMQTATASLTGPDGLKIAEGGATLARYRLDQ